MPRTKTVENVSTKVKPVKQENLTKKFKEVIERESDTWVEFSKIAYQIYKTDWWKKEGYESIQEFIEKESNGRVSYQVFMLRVKMGEAIEKYNIPKDMIVDLGWSKFKEIAGLALDPEAKVSPEELKEFIEECRNKSFKDIQDFVRKERLRRSNVEDQKRVTLKFLLIDEQDNIVKEALDTAMELAETSNPTIGLVYICTEFLMNHSTDNELVNEIRKKVEEVSSVEVKKAPHKPHSNKGKKGSKKAKSEEPTKETNMEAVEEEEFEALFDAEEETDDEE